MPPIIFKAMQRKRYIKPEQAAKLINYFFDKEAQTPYIESTNKNKAYFIYTLWRTGRRVSEIVGNTKEIERVPGLRPMDFDREDRTITFHILKKHPVKKRNKQGKIRTEEEIAKRRFKKPSYEESIAYDDEFFDMMIDYIDTLGIHDTQRIFPYHRCYIDRVIKQASEVLKLHLGYKKVINPDTGLMELEKMKVNIHAFRHGFSMNFLKEQSKNPLALPLLQELLCHSNINVTKTYVKFDQSDRRKMLNEVFKADG